MYRALAIVIKAGFHKPLNLVGCFEFRCVLWKPPLTGCADGLAGYELSAMCVVPGLTACD